jgi:hypothetical protein
VQSTEGGYAVNAVPEVYKSTGSKTFFSDQTMAVHEHLGRNLPPGTMGCWGTKRRQQLWRR